MSSNKATQHNGENKMTNTKCTIEILIGGDSCRHNYNYKILFDHTAVAVCSKCKKRVKA